LNAFAFGDLQSSDSYGIVIERKSKYNAPEREVSRIHVPGRNGDVLIDNGSFQNVTVSYSCACLDRAALLRFRARLADGAGQYRELRDSYDPGFYRMAAFIGPLEVEEALSGKAYRFTIQFTCKPERFYDTDTPTYSALNGPATVPAPAAPDVPWYSRPLISLYVNSGVATASVTVGASTVATFTGASGASMFSATVDYQAGAAYQTFADGTRALGNYGDLAPLRFNPGTAYTVNGGITGGSGVRTLSVTPRWYTL
jgi:phage-related protein